MGREERNVLGLRGILWKMGMKSWLMGIKCVSEWESWTTMGWETIGKGILNGGGLLKKFKINI